VEFYHNEHHGKASSGLLPEVESDFMEH